MSWDAKIRCIDDKGKFHTKGKIYNVVNGKFEDDEGLLCRNEYSNIDDLCAGFISKFELVEEYKSLVSHLQHYNQGKYEPINVIKDWKLNFNLGNVVKYIARCEYKGNKLQDLKKAKEYLEHEIKSIEDTLCK